MRTPLALGISADRNRIHVRIIHQDEQLRCHFGGCTVFDDPEFKMCIISDSFPQLEHYMRGRETLFIRGTNRKKDNAILYKVDLRFSRNYGRKLLKKAIAIVCKLNSYICYSPFIVGMNYKPYLEFQK